MIRSVVGLACALALISAGCGKDKPPDYDRSTPEATVRAFFGALNKQRIPADIEVFFTSDRDIGTWRMRCKSRGCTGGEVSRLEVVERYQYRAVLSIDYAVRGGGGGRVMAGEGSPVTLIREGKAWKIAELGKRVTLDAAEDRGE